MDAKNEKPLKRAVPVDLSGAGLGASVDVTRRNSGGERISINELKKLVGVLPGNSMGELKDITTIGVGGVGAVFSAHEPVLNREIAIKILRPNYQQHRNAVGDFIREARITAQIDHPNVIPVHRMGVFDDSGVYFTMKKVEGVTLSYILKQLKAGDPEMLRLYNRRRLLAIFAAICNGVAFAHSKGIIHRDLKPLNIMIGDYGEVFVMDWGLAVYRAENDHSFPARKIEIGELPEEQHPETAEESAPPEQSGQSVPPPPDDPIQTTQITLPDSSELKADGADGKKSSETCGETAPDEITKAFALYTETQKAGTSERSPKSSKQPDGKKKDKLSGTPAFIAPELVRGGKADELSDIYALGAILYTILTHEQSPFEPGLEMNALLQKVANGNFLRPRRRARRLKIPHELEAITLKAMACDPKKRYQSVEALLDDVRNYQDQFPVTAYSPLIWYRFYKLLRRRPLIPLVLLAALLTLGTWNGFVAVRELLMARALYAESVEQITRADNIRSQALSAHRRLNDLYRQSGSTDSIGGALALRGNSVRLGDEYELLCGSAWEKLRKILELKVGHEKTISLLAKLLADQFLYAFATDDQQMAARLGSRMDGLRKGDYKKMVSVQPSLAQFMTILRKNQGELLIRSNFAWVELTAVAASPENGKEPERYPLHFAPERNTLPAGSYAVVVSLKEGGTPANELMRFPLVVVRGRTEELTLELPEQRPRGMVYIPGGTFIFGNRMADDQAARARLDGYFISRHEVTFAEYLEFWKSLKNASERSRFTGYGEKREPLRKIEPLWNEQGMLNPELSPSMPVIGITPEAAEAYCRWKSRQTGLVYRLPTALEWEKAARGVDGREYVWGNEWVRGNANTAGETGEPGYAEKVESNPKDYSVYGVYDMAGNARELVTGPGGDTPYMVKGGGFASLRRFARIPENAYETTLPDLGFRCVVEPRAGASKLGACRFAD